MRARITVGGTEAMKAIRSVRGATKTLFAAAGATVVITLLPLSPGITNEDAAVPALVMALVCAVVGAAIGVHRSHEAGSIDPFHPLLFPALYVSAACLLPTLWIWSGHPIDYLPRRAMSTYTPELMALAAVGMVLGSAVPFARTRPRPTVPGEARWLAIAGRTLFCIPLGLAAIDYGRGAIRTRGLGQNTVTLLDSVAVLGVVVAAGAVVLMLAARQRRGQSLLSPLEWLAVLAYVALTGLNGSRGSAITVIITVLYFATRKKGALLRTAIGLGAVAAFAYAVLTYRSNSRGEQSELSALVMLLRDLGSVPFTTGATGQAVADSGPLWGSTIVAGLLRQIPGPVANLVFGQPDDTGAFRFRTMTGFNNDSNGYGFSIPAEGVMNFGAVGAFVLPLAFGVLLAWLYSRSSEKGSRGLHLAYVVAVASLPFGLRSDVLGAVKGALYPVLIISVVFLTARWLERRLQQRNETHSGESASPVDPTSG